MLHLYEGPDKEHTTDSIEKRRNQAQYLAGLEPMTSLSQGMCPTHVLQLLPYSEIPSGVTTFGEMANGTMTFG